MSEMDGFELVVAGKVDLDAMTELTIIGWAEDPIWQALMRNVAREDVFNLLASIHRTRFPEPLSKYYKIQVKETKRLVGWTSLLWPNPDKQEEDKEPEVPKLPSINDRMATIFCTRLMPSSKEIGYDDRKHFHRRRTFVHPDYQKWGFGTWLTDYCNKIAEEVQGVTFVGARPSSRPLFEKGGFKIVATIDVDVTGDGSEMDVHYTMRRDPPTK